MKIGIDLGGSNMRIAVVGEGAALSNAHKEAVGEPRDPDSIVERCAKLCEKLAGDERGISVGVQTFRRAVWLRHDEPDAYGDRRRHGQRCRQRKDRFAQG